MPRSGLGSPKKEKRRRKLPPSPPLLGSRASGTTGPCGSFGAGVEEERKREVVKFKKSGGGEKGRTLSVHRPARLSSVFFDFLFGGRRIIICSSFFFPFTILISRTNSSSRKRGPDSLSPLRPARRIEPRWGFDLAARGTTFFLETHQVLHFFLLSSFFRVKERSKSNSLSRGR